MVRTGGRTVFTVISIPPGLSSADHERAVATSPPFTEADEEYPAMLERTGWEITDHIDLSTEFIGSTRRMLEEEEAHADELRALHGEADEETVADRHTGTRFAAARTVRRDGGPIAENLEIPP